MPEGPELCMNSRFVNSVSSGRLFAGKILKSSVSKCNDVDFHSDAYVISSESRGKELALTLECLRDPLNKLRLLFRFGMSGRFRFTPIDEVPKHAHLQFFTQPRASDPDTSTTPQEQFVLSFVDVRRFGSWHVMPEGWGENRGPDPMFEYDLFRRNVVENLEDPAFNKPICEAMLNQKYFNGIGNYLRAEILFRVSVPPFVCARKVLEEMCVDDMKEDKNDILFLCHKVPLEVTELKQKLGKSESMVMSEDDYRAFCRWLQCYENPAMNTARDHNNRTIWFKGEAGPMCPKTQPHKKRRNKGQRAPGKVSNDVKIEETQERATENAEKNFKMDSGPPEGQETGVSLIKSDSDSSLDTNPSNRKRKTKEMSGSGARAKRMKSGSSDTKGKARKPPLLPTRRSSRLKKTQAKKYTV